MALVGIGALLFHSRWRVVITGEGLDVRKPLSERRFAWRDVATIQVLEKVIRFDFADQSHVDVRLDIPGIRALFETAGANVPQTAWRR